MKNNFPLTCQIDLTYKCGLSCLHCYCLGLGSLRKTELSTAGFKHIMDMLSRERFLHLILSGGEPLTRNDFLELYLYARKKGFLVTVFTNAQEIGNEVLECWEKVPPYSIEVTFNGASKHTYESVTRVRGSYERALENIHSLAERKFPVAIRMNCLKENGHELGKVKVFAEKVLGRPGRGKYRFKYDPFLLPRLDGDLSPCRHRLSFGDILRVQKLDADIWRQYRSNMVNLSCVRNIGGSALYLCDSWKNHVFVNPYGRLKFCLLSDEFSVDLTKVSVGAGMRGMSSRIRRAKFSTDSECKGCRLRAICYNCPAKAYLETGNRESKVQYYCDLAERTAAYIARRSRRRKSGRK